MQKAVVFNPLTLKICIGLVHYRRILELSEDDVLRLMDNGVDAVLPFPMPYEPNIEVHHKRYLKKEDWDAVLKAISGRHPLWHMVLSV